MAIDDTKPVEPPVPDYDAMSSAFDELTAPEPEKKPEDDPTSKVDTSAGDDKAEGEATPPEGEAAPPEGEAAPPEGEAKPPEGEAKPPEGAAPPTSEGEDWEARFKELEAKVNRQPEPQQKPPVETPPADIYAADEKEFLTAYEKDWPDVTKGEALKRRAEYAELVKHIFGEIARVYDPLVLRGAQAADTVAETNTLNAILAAHADYDDAMYNDVLKWAEGLTGTRKRIVEAVIAEGEPSELVELISDFKTATGRKPRVVAGSAPAAPAASVTELSAKAKQAAKALGVVDSKRTAPVSGQPDPNDFDSAWEDAVGSK